eukprot:TRINITY_DN37602_c0_g1_i2.p1 TRINITY_DN37602_c0_g1~~TRINITY_DN37602_c0_g1_i2.p1  ORF type:complete len:340 (+),score=53.91 TRINITY_DN37602_c0_g1_i2:717-1736(+)
MLVTRLGCEATKRTEKDKQGNESVIIEREPRVARFNVHHHRQIADGLHLTGLEGEDADLELPAYDIRSEESPSLFLTLPDPMQEFTLYLKHVMAGVSIINANKPFTHLSRFVFIDQQSMSDDGNLFSTGMQEQQKLQSSELVSVQKSLMVQPAEASLVAVEGGALHAIGAISPNGWLWNGKGFYDNRPGHWSMWGDSKELLSYKDFSARIPIAADLNSKYQDATEVSPSVMRQQRDAENCFRIVELSIPTGADVVVLAKPVLQEGPRPIKLIPPPGPRNAADIDSARFQFRILQGHTIDNLNKHRNASQQVYYGFACMGLFTVWYGEEQIRDSLEVTYS